MNRQHFSPPFSPQSMPAWRCPHCVDGALAPVEDSLNFSATAASQEARDDPDWGPEWDVDRFFMKMKCVKCNDPVLCVGTTQSIKEHDDEYGWVFSGALVPTYFEPYVPVILIPSKCPDSVSTEVLNASSLIWCSPSSSGNKIRAAVERLMDVQGVANSSVLHNRIQAFASTNQDVSDKLLAIKWIGNTGSHSDDLELEDVLNAFELLEYCLEELYEGRSVRLKALAASINAHKGPPPK
jgi:Domain of unknown function (DUF4145)